MIRALAGHDPRRAAEIHAGWPVRDGLLAYERLLREDALEGYRHDEMQFVTLLPHVKKGSLKPPPIPALLRD